MKKTQVSKQILKAITVGLSASMLLQPVAAFADEVEGGAAPAPVDGEITENEGEKLTAADVKAEVVALEAEDKAETMELDETGAAEQSEAAVEGVVEAIRSESEEDTGLNEYLYLDETAVSAVDTASETLEDDSLVNAEDGTVTEALEKELTEAAADLETAAGLEAPIAAAETVLSEKEEAIDETDKTTADTELGNAKAAAQAAEDAADEANKAITAANDAIDALTEESTDEDIQKVKDQVADVKELVGTAEDTTEDDTTYGKIAKAEADFDTASENFEGAKKDYNEAVGDYNTALDTLQGLEKSYNDAIDASLDDVAEAKDVLGTESDDLESLNTELTENKDAYVNDGYIAIQQAEAAAEKNPNLNNYRAYFDALVQYYYVPDILGGTFEGIDKKPADVSGKYIYEDGTVSTKGNVLRYFVVTYKDKDGNEQTKYLGYKTVNYAEDGNMNLKFGSNGKGGIVIFEKTEHGYVINGESITEDQLAVLDTVNEDGTVNVVEDTRYFFADAAQKTTEEKDVLLVKSGKDYVAFKTENGVVTKDSDEVPEATEEGKTEESVIEAILSGETEADEIVDLGETSEAYTLKNKVLTKTETTGYAVTSFTGASLAAQDNTLEDEAAAKAAYLADLQDKVNDLGENETIVIAEKEYSAGDTVSEDASENGYKGTSEGTETVTGYDVEVSYYKQFTTTVHVPSTGQGQYNSYEDMKAAVLRSAQAQLKNGEVAFEVELKKGKIEEKSNKNKHTYKYKEDKTLVVHYYSLADEKTATVTISGTDRSVITDDSVNAALEAKGLDFVNASYDADKAKENKEVTGTLYGYEESKYVVKSESEGTATVKTQWKQDKSVVTVATEYRNDNWYTGDIILATNQKAEGTDYKTDGKQDSVFDHSDSNRVLSDAQAEDTIEFRYKIEHAQEIKDKYFATLDKVTEAKAKVQAAEEAVAEIEEHIKALKIEDKRTAKDLYEKDLEAAKAQLKAAQDYRDSLEDLLEELEDKLPEDEDIDNTDDDDDDSEQQTGGPEREPEEDDDQPSEEPEEDDDQPSEEPEEDDDQPSEEPEEDDDQPSEEPEEDDDQPSEEPEDDDDQPSEEPEEDDDQPSEEPEEDQPAEEDQPVDVVDVTPSVNPAEAVAPAPSQVVTIPDAEPAPAAAEPAAAPAAVVEEAPATTEAAPEAVETAPVAPAAAPAAAHAFVAPAAAPAAPAAAPAVTETETENTETEATATENTTEIEEEGPALADAPETKEMEEEKIPLAAAAVIADDETPLANLPEASKMNWWWLLLVLILGTSGAEMYRRHIIKKNASKVKDDQK